MKKVPLVNRAKKVKEMIRQVMDSFGPSLEGHRVFLFGSRAGGNARDRSDFDVGVLGDDSLSTKVFFSIAEALDNLPTLYCIDWVDLNRASPVFLKEALKNAEVIYGKTVTP